MDLNTLLIGVAILTPYLFFFLYIKNTKNEEKEETIDEEAITSKLYELLNDEQSPLSKRLKDVDDSYQKFIGENASINTVLDDLKSWQITLNNILAFSSVVGNPPFPFPNNTPALPTFTLDISKLASFIAKAAEATAN